jgi:hypothetical protein
MKTAVLFGGSYPGSSTRTTPLLFQPAVQKAGKPEVVVIPFSDSKVRSEATGVRVPVSEPAVWEWLELGFLGVFASSATAKGPTLWISGEYGVARVDFSRSPQAQPSLNLYLREGTTAAGERLRLPQNGGTLELPFEKHSLAAVANASPRKGVGCDGRRQDSRAAGE